MAKRTREYPLHQLNVGCLILSAGVGAIAAMLMFWLLVRYEAWILANAYWLSSGFRWTIAIFLVVWVVRFFRSRRRPSQMDTLSGSRAPSLPAGSVDHGTFARTRSLRGVDAAITEEQEAEIEALIARLANDDADVRRLAVSRLADFSQINVVEALFPLLEDSSEPVRRLTYHALTSLLSLPTLGPFLWRIQTEAIPADFQPGLSEAVGRSIVLHEGRYRPGMVEDAEKLAERLIAYFMEKKNSQNAAAICHDILRYYRCHFDELPDIELSPALTKAGQFCYDLGFHLTQKLADTGQVYHIRPLARELIHLTASLGNAIFAWHGLACLSQALARGGDDSLSLEIYTEITNLIQRTWYLEPIEETNLQRFFADKALIFDGLALCHLRLGAHAQAWEALEAEKTRYLGDLIARRHRPRRRRYEQVTEDFWGAVHQARTAAYGRDPAAADREDILSTVSTQPHDPPLMPQHLQAMLEYPKPSHGGLLSIIEWLWELAVRLPDMPMATQIRAEFRNIRRVVRVILAEYRKPRMPEFDLWLEETFENSRRALEDLGNHGELPGLWMLFGELGFRWESLMQMNDWPLERHLLELEALQEVLDWITLESPVSLIPATQMARSHFSPNISFGGQVTMPATPRRTRLDKSETLLFNSLQQFRRSRWQYVYRLARGETANFAQMRAALTGRPDTALIAFQITSLGTLIYLFRGTPEKARVTLFPESTDADCNKLVTAPHFTLGYLQRLMDEHWVKPYLRHVKYSGKSDSISQDQQWRNEMDWLLGYLFRELLRPVDQQLKAWNVRKLILVPHRSLHLLPLHACWREIEGAKRYWLEDYEISYAPSYTLAEICRERSSALQSDGSLIVFTDPSGDLPFAAYEARQVISLYQSQGSRLYAGDDARLSALAAVGHSDIFHFAGHGCYDWQDPLRSHLIFARDEQLELGTLFDEALSLSQTSLVVLSACETNITDPDDLADEYLSLASGFLFAGAPAILSTLWVVNDLASALLLECYDSRVTIRFSSSLE
jgi:hypothetical protein